MIRGDLAMITAGSLAGTTVIVIDEVKKGDLRTCYCNNVRLEMRAAADGYVAVSKEGLPIPLKVNGKEVMFQPLLIDSNALVIMAGRNVKP